MTVLERPPTAPVARSQLMPPPSPATETLGARPTRNQITKGITIVGGIVVGFLGAQWADRLAIAPDNELGGLMLLGLVLALWPNVLLHEAGHALAGVLAGMRVIAFGIGPIRLERGANRWHWRFARSIRGILGFAVLLPNDGRSQSRRARIAFLLGGPGANLLTALVAFVVLPLTLNSPWLAGLTLGAALSALLLGLTNLVPIETKGWRSDGRGVLDVLRQSPDGELHHQLLQVLGLSMVGVRPRDWPDEVLPRIPSTTSTNSMLGITMTLLQLSRAMDRRDAQEAEPLAESLGQRYWVVHESFRPHVAVTMATYAAVMGRDAALIDAWRPLCEGGMLDLCPYRAWLDAESAALKGDFEQARDALANAYRELGRVHDPASLEVLRDDLNALGARLEHAGARQLLESV